MVRYDCNLTYFRLGAHFWAVLTDGDKDFVAVSEPYLALMYINQQSRISLCIDKLAV